VGNDKAVAHPTISTISPRITLKLDSSTQMKLLRIYADTSVIGGYFDPEFETGSRRLLDGVKQGRCLLLLSQVVLDELQPAPSTWDLLGKDNAVAHSTVWLTITLLTLFNLFKWPKNTFTSYQALPLI